MILFEEDWGKYPTARPDWDTKNRTWVNLALKYKQMGVKNFAFFLALVDQELKGVDPHDPDLTLEQMTRIGKECFINPWYFFRECVRVPSQAGSDSNPLEANRGNIALFWCFFNHITTILIQIRQTGKSVSTDVLMSYLLNLLCINTKINLLTKDDDLRRHNVVRLKDIINELPPYLKKINKTDANNGEEITVNALGNRYNTHVPQSSPKRALNLGRGLTTPILHIDEAPFQPNIKDAYPAMMAATNAVFDEAKRKNEPHGIIITTTAGKKDDKDGRFVYKMVGDAMPWSESLFDCKNEDDLRKVVKLGSRSQDYLVNITLNHRQLGKSDEWLREKIKQSRGDIEAINRDYFNVWTSGSQRSPFTADIAEKIANGREEKQFDYISEKYGYCLRFYIPEHTVHQRLNTGRFVLSMDPSDAGGGDDISFYLTDAESLETIAVATINETNLFLVSSWVCDFLVEYKNVTAIIERRSTGSSILDHLLWFLPQKGEDPFKRLYNRVVNDYLEYPDRYKEILVPMSRRPEDIYTRYKTAFGWATSGSGMTSRSGLYSTTLQNGIRLAGGRLKDSQLINQLLSLEIKNGKVDHPPGEHDDLVIGFLLAVWFLTQGTNLSHYGLDPRIVLSKTREKNVTDPIQHAFEVRQSEIRNQIESICEELSDESDDLISYKLEQKIRVLERSLVKGEDELNSVDEMIRKAREKKKERMRQKKFDSRDSYFSSNDSHYNQVVNNYYR